MFAAATLTIARVPAFLPRASILARPSAALAALGGGQLVKKRGSLKQLFAELDSDGSGAIERDELISGLARLRLDAGTHLDGLLRQLDMDGNGLVTYKELVRSCSPMDAAAATAAAADR